MASILDQTTNNTDARLVKYTCGPVGVSGKTNTDETLVRGWFHIVVNAASGATIQSLAQAMNGTATYANPAANGKAYSGTWANSEIVAIDEDSSGTNERIGSIIQTLKKVATITSVSDLAALDPIITRGNEILQTFETATGERETVMFTYKGINIASRDALFDITDANMVSSIASQVSATGITWTYMDRKFVGNDDRTGTFSVLFKETDWLTVVNVNTSNTVAVYSRFTYATGNRENSETLIWPNINSTTSLAIYNDAKTNAENLAASNFTPSTAVLKLKTVERVPMEEGRYQVERTSVTPNSSLITAVWPPYSDETNETFQVKRYRRYKDETTGLWVEQVRTWVFHRRDKYSISASLSQAWLNGYNNTEASGYKLLERGSGIRTVDNSGEKFHSTAIYENTTLSSVGWVDE